jgi:hypothetical protein
MCKTSYLFQSKNPDGYGDNGVVKMVFDDKWSFFIWNKGVYNVFIYW